MRYAYIKFIIQQKINKKLRFLGKTNFSKNQFCSLMYLTLKKKL